MIDRLNMHRRPVRPLGSGYLPQPQAARPAPPSAKPDVAAVFVGYPEIERGKTRKESSTRGEPGLSIAADAVPTGTYAINEDGLYFVCPCGCRELSWVPVKTGDKKAGSWRWNGDQERPVLSPSIAKRYGCRWHGFLGAQDGSKPGVWITC